MAANQVYSEEARTVFDRHDQSAAAVEHAADSFEMLANRLCGSYPSTKGETASGPRPVADGLFAQMDERTARINVALNRIQQCFDRIDRALP